VDGFRFDLGTILAREPNGFDNQGGFLKACSQDPVLGTVKLIAEPWDLGPGGYQVGGFPPGWAEWNDRFRDTVREFWKGGSSAAELTKRMTASGEIFNVQGRRPWSSINFITAHDGFTLNDIVSYNEKHNEANGEDNKDGSSENHSWNCGVEGPTDNPEVNKLRARQLRNLLGTLLLSQGTPMILAGDEFGRTQNGNNNAYCQDNEISWLNWNMSEKGTSLIRYVQKLTGFRHKYPILRRNLFLTGEYNEELCVKDVTWINANGKEMEDRNWGDTGMRCFGMLIDGRAQTSGVRQQGKEATLLIVINDHYDLVEFTLPEAVGGSEWSLLIDTNLEEEDNRHLSVQALASYGVTARSLLLFALQPE
jgi:isoamylase